MCADHVGDPGGGVVAFDAEGRATSIEEKPAKPKSIGLSQALDVDVTPRAAAQIEAAAAWWVANMTGGTRRHPIPDPGSRIPFF